MIKDFKYAEDDQIVEEPQLKFNLKSSNSEKSNSASLNMLSLFSGCGGMDLGFEGGFTVLGASINAQINPQFAEKVCGRYAKLRKTRFKTVFANDILPEARNAWVNYFSKESRSPEDYHLESIVDLVKLHKSGESVFPKNIDIVTGGFPCQDFSISGLRNGFNSSKNHRGVKTKNKIPSIETRGQLYMWMKEVIEITQPKIFIAENVKGLVNLSNVKEIIQNDFSSVNGNGYLVLEPQVLHAADFGVPQSRERVIFIGIKKSELNKKALTALTKDKIPEAYNPYPKITHSFTKKGDNLKNPVTLNQTFKDLLEPDQSPDLSQKFYSKAKFMGKHCQGQTEIKLDWIGPTIRAEHHGNIEFRRLSVKNGGIITSELSSGLKERRLTPRECALIQTFPIDYDFVIENKTGRSGSFLVSPSKAYKLIGNAVPPLLAYHLAHRLQELWDNFFGN